MTYLPMDKATKELLAYDVGVDSKLSERKFALRQVFEATYGVPFDQSAWLELQTEHGPQLIRCSDVVGLFPEVRHDRGMARMEGLKVIQTKPPDPSKTQVLTLLVLRTGDRIIVDAKPEVVASWITPWWSRPGPDPMEGERGR